MPHKIIGETLKGESHVLQDGAQKAMWGVAKGSFDVQGRDDEADGSISTTASCIKTASSGERAGTAPHKVGGMAWYTPRATRFRMSIQMSFVSMVAHTMGLQLSGFAQSPLLYSGCTRFAQSGCMSFLPMAMS